MRVAFIRTTFRMRLAFVRIAPEDGLSPEGALSGLFLIRMTLHTRVVFARTVPHEDDPSPGVSIPPGLHSLRTLFL